MKETGKKTIDVAGKPYNITYNHKYSGGGAVIIGGTQNGLLTNISYQGDGINGKITIEFSADQDPAWLSRMFPRQSVLAIDSDIFGSCDMTTETAPIPLDGYIVIQSVNAVSAREVEVTGSVAAPFYSLFEWSNYSFDALESGNAERRHMLENHIRPIKDLDVTVTDKLNCSLSLDVTPHYDVTRGKGSM
jgi:hypothetical protein